MPNGAAPLARAMGVPAVSVTVAMGVTVLVPLSAT